MKSNRRSHATTRAYWIEHYGRQDFLARASMPKAAARELELMALNMPRLLIQRAPTRPTNATN